ncbi:MAG: response regulator, partial [Candidatus Omnitrophota bacterium]|nr:response regulator [Candidatus Omnitrophota bacterium]
MTEALKTKKVLVVDDDPTVLKLLEKVFASGGYEVVCSKDAPCGLEMALKGKPDLIILDMNHNGTVD